MESNYFYNIVEKKNIDEYLDNLDEKTLFIYSPTSLDKIKLDNKQMLMENWHKISKDIIQIDKYIEKLYNIKEIVTLGGGSTIDIGKYIAYKLNIKYTCIPSMLSTNSYATNKVALIKNDKKITLEAKMPDKIIIDDDILKLSKNENLYGLADVLSIYTALYDWKIANEDIEEEINQEIYQKAENLLNEVLKFIANNSLDEIVQDNIQLFKFIGTAGYITNLYGTGRPESGSEHIMAKEIERRIDIPHGISVSTGILVMSLMQNRDIKKLSDAIIKMQIFQESSKYGLTKEVIKQSFLALEPRINRYTVIDRYANNEEFKQSIISKFFEKVDRK